MQNPIFCNQQKNLDFFVEDVVQMLQYMPPVPLPKKNKKKKDKSGGKDGAGGGDDDINEEMSTVESVCGKWFCCFIHIFFSLL